MRRLARLAALLLALAAAPTRSEPITGQDDPRLQAALALWLADDEATALPALAALARDENRAAQILLALVDRNPAYQGPWLLDLPRTERLALLRGSGRSWMAAAAVDTPLARLWRLRDGPETSIADALAFAALGENRAARETLQAIAARQRHGFSAFADDPRYPVDMRHLVWRERAETPGGRARAEAEIARLVPGDPVIGRFEDRPVAAAERDAWLAAAPLAGPLRATCAAFCPAHPLSCHRAAYVLVGGHALLVEFGTPSETLVPPDTWNASPRGSRALLRTPSARFRFGYQTAEAVRAEDACLADALAGEVARYYE